ncbi:LuxR C-terminal-related transcriptional regulator [Azorhizobium sp. AG788]|uniref:response regulator transcription factor n=1 Tax=Azorhizobium sp. AG788 TaxID=2183897 RepID=UPI003139C8E7
MTGQASIPLSVPAMKAGAVDFVITPFRVQDMPDAVLLAIDRGRTARDGAEAMVALQALSASLTLRKHEVMALVTSGPMIKQSAAELGLSEITVKIHRGDVMQKMPSRSLADLLRFAELLCEDRPKR